MHGLFRDYLEQHLSSKKHKTTIQAESSSQNLTSYFVSSTSRESNKILAAEATLAFHTVKHHFSFRSSDCTHSLLKTLFDDSTVAKSLSSGHTKTRAISINVIAPSSINSILSDLSCIPFISVATDASNYGALKLFPLLVQYFDWNKGVQTKLVNLDSLTNETSDTIVDYIRYSLAKLGILDKVVSFASDNTNTNFGGVNRRGTENVYFKLKTLLNRELIGAGCPVHIVHNAAQHAFDRLPVDR